MSRHRIVTSSPIFSLVWSAIRLPIRAGMTSGSACFSEPVGMVSFGSPIALFLFRNYQQLGGQHGPKSKPNDLWRFACPPSFRRDGQWQGITWRWQNFWHAADFVGHRLSPLYAQGYPTQPSDQAEPFVRDVRMKHLVSHPVDAHMSYWQSRCMVQQIGLQLAVTLLQMNGYVISNSHALFKNVSRP